MTGFYVTFIFLSSFGTNCQDSLKCDFLFIEHLSHRISWNPPPTKHKPSHLFKFTLKTGLNDDAGEEILDDYEDGMDIEDIVNDIGIENVFKYNMRLRYRLKGNNKVYIGTQIKGKTFSPYFGLFLSL